MRPNHLAIGLSVSAVLCCLVAGAGMSQAPIMSGGRHPSLSEVAGMIAVPTVVAALATWAAWQHRPLVLCFATALVGVFSVVTGFSIGSAFLPALALLVWGSFASVANGVRPQGPS
jgi:hypothetical protein